MRHLLAGLSRPQAGDVAPQGRWLGTTGFTRGAPLGTLARIKIKMKLTQNHLFFKKVGRIPDSNLNLTTHNIVLTFFKMMES
jgi:hypothetical protein